MQRNIFKAKLLVDLYALPGGGEGDNNSPRRTRRDRSTSPRRRTDGTAAGALVPVDGEEDESPTARGSSRRGGSRRRGQEGSKTEKIHKLISRAVPNNPQKESYLEQINKIFEVDSTSRKEKRTKRITDGEEGVEEESDDEVYDRAYHFQKDVEAIKTGEDAISFFAKNGSNTDLKFVYCNRKSSSSSPTTLRGFAEHARTNWWWDLKQGFCMRTLSRESKSQKRLMKPYGRRS